MSDTTSEHDDLSTTQEYTIAGIVILFFGILYWLFNYGFPDINLNVNSNGAQPAAVAGGHSQAQSQQQALSSQAKPAAEAGTAADDNTTTIDANSKTQQFATKQAAANADKQADKQQAQITQSSSAETLADNSSDQTDKDQAAKDGGQAENTAANTDSTAAQSENTTNITNTTNNSTATAQQTQSTAAAAATSLAQRVITDPAVLKLRDHLLNGELEQAVLMDSVSFTDKSAEATLSADTQMLDLAALMQRNPDTKMLLRGHTANEGDEAASKQLSLERATALGQKLVEAGAAADNIIIMGMGDAEPLSEDNNQQNRGNNRRIDVAITQ